MNSDSLEGWIDLGHDHLIRFTCWKPDRELNPQYSDIPDIDRLGAMVTHLTPSGEVCKSSITFDSAAARQLCPQTSSFWTIETEDPITLSPSLLCTRCGDHGFIRKGKWVGV